MCTHVDGSACDSASGLRVRRVEERLKGPHGNDDAATEAHARELALPDELVGVASRDAQHLTGLRHREREAADRDLVGGRTHAVLKRPSGPIFSPDLALSGRRAEATGYSRTSRSFESRSWPHISAAAESIAGRTLA
jgi:hypothetical protein